jgi:glycine betaine/choline ABC-type transport system substrate-binding protein
MRYLYQLPFQLALQLIVGLLLSSSIYLTAAAADSEAVTNADATIVIGSKNFGESYLL